MNGQTERLMVLDMLAEGKITADEAEQLFKAMEEEPQETNADETPASDSAEWVPGLSHLSKLSGLSSLSSLSPADPESPRNARTRELLGALKEAGIDHVTMSDLQEMKIHNLSADYVREMRGLGIEPDDVAAFRRPGASVIGGAAADQHQLAMHDRR